MGTFSSGPGGDLGANPITTTAKITAGSVAVSESAAPAAPADGAGGILYCKADGKLYWISNELAETELTAGGGGGGAVTALNNATANELVTVGATTTELDAEAKLTFSGATLTVGNATAEDTLIVFDGNAADFRIGIDDDSDTMEIGAGAAHDTTAAIIIDASGHVTKIGQDSPSNNEALTWDGSKAVWAAPSSKKSWTMHFSNRVNVNTASTDLLYFRTNSAGSVQGGDWSVSDASLSPSPDYSAGDNSFQCSIKDSWKYVSCGIVPYNSTCKSVAVGYHPYQTAVPNAAVMFDVWKATIGEGDALDTTVTWNLICSGGGTDFYADGAGSVSEHYMDFKSPDVAVSQGDMIGISWRGRGNAMGGGKFHWWQMTMNFQET